MKILVLGNDSRAHAFIWKLFKTPSDVAILCAPGNGGTTALVPPIALDSANVAAVARWSFEANVDIILPTTSGPLCAGLADELADLNVEVLGPPKRTVMLGQSYCRVKEFLIRNDLPTAKGRVLSTLTMAERYLAAQSLPVLIKTDLPEKKEVICPDRYSALTLLREFFNAPLPIEVVIEQYTPGVQVSLAALTDGRTVLPLLATRFYEHLNEGDQGPLVPGMGAQTGIKTYAQKLTVYLHQKLIIPTLQAFQVERLPYLGFLGLDCNITAQGPQIMGLRSHLRNLEAEVVLPRLETDLFTLLQATVSRQLDQVGPLQWLDKATIGLALVMQGYPYHFPLGQAIGGLDKVEEGLLVFHNETHNPLGMRYNPVTRRGTSPLFSGLFGGGSAESTAVTNTGGYVLTLVALGETLQEAREKALSNAERITFPGRTYRKDIGLHEFS